MRTPRRSLALALLALPLAGCDAVDLLDPTRGAGGSYDLVRLDDRRLPQLVDEYTLRDGTECELELVAGSIVLETRYHERFELHLAYRERCRGWDGRVDVAYPVEREPGSFDVRGDRIVFYPDHREYFDVFDARLSRGRLVAEIGHRWFEFERDRVGW